MLSKLKSYSLLAKLQSFSKVTGYLVQSQVSTKSLLTAAKEFLDWLYTSEEGKTAVIEDFKFIPAYDGFDAGKISDPLAKEIYQYSQDGKTLAWTFMGYPTGWGQEKLGVNIQTYVSGEMSWDDLVKESSKA